MSFTSNIVEPVSAALSDENLNEYDTNNQSSHDFQLNRLNHLNLRHGRNLRPWMQESWLNNEERLPRLLAGAARTAAKILSYDVLDDCIGERPSMRDASDAFPMPITMPFNVDYDDFDVGPRDGWRQKSATFPIVIGDCPRFRGSF